jgi:hypothetical protein
MCMMVIVAKRKLRIIKPEYLMIGFSVSFKMMHLILQYKCATQQKPDSNTVVGYKKYMKETWPAKSKVF